MLSHQFTHHLNKIPSYQNLGLGSLLNKLFFSLKTEPEDVINIPQMVLNINLYDEIKLLTFAHRDEALKCLKFI
jgi:hypothetical protein